MNTPFDSSADAEPPRRAPRLRQHSRASRSTPHSVLECRFSREVYYAIGVWVLCGLAFQIMLFWSPRQNDFWNLTLTLTAFFHLPNLFFIWWAERIRVWADEEELRFRGLGKTKRVAWDDIEDFGWKMAASNSKSQAAGAVLFVRGRRKPQLLSRNLTHFDALLQFIASHVTQARVSSWQALETRDESEWPKVFVYRDVSGWKLVGAYIGFTLALLACIVLEGMSRGLAAFISGFLLMWGSLGVGGKVAFVLWPLSICGIYPLIILARFPSIKAARRFLGQRIIATREGLEFERDGQSTFVSWGNIERYELEALPGNFQLPVAVIHTKRDRYEFHSGIVNGQVLRALVVDRATNASTQKWNYAAGASDEILGGANSLWRGGTIGVGSRIHHYRTRTNRAVLIFSGSLFLALLFLVIFGRGIPLSNGQIPSTADNVTRLILCVLLTLPTLWGIASYWFSSVEVSEEGIRQKGVWGERHMNWSEIQSAKFNGYWLEVQGKTTIRIGLVADIDYVLKEVEERSHITIQRTHDFKLGT